MNKIKKIMAAAVIVIAGLFGVTRPAFAGDCPPNSLRPTFTNSIAECQMDKDQTPENTGLFKMIQIVINIILSVLGVITVFMIILGGINFMTSQGDPGKTKKGRDTILYGIIGLVIALLAYAIVNFVLANIFAPATTATPS